MFVTCYCDASFKKGKSSYAIWLKSENGTKQLYGPCPEWIKDNNAAELYAMYRAIQETVQVWPHSKTILICSDSQTALRCLWPWTNPNSNKNIRLVENLTNELIEKIQIQIKTKYVKGHQRKANDIKSAWLNNWCDKQSRKVRKP